MTAMYKQIKTQKSRLLLNGRSKIYRLLRNYVLFKSYV